MLPTYSTLDACIGHVGVIHAELVRCCQSSCMASTPGTESDRDSGSLLPLETLSNFLGILQYGCFRNLVSLYFPLLHF